jgi:2,3-bisphosphoglycerate-dependent phosphoglycerate mutase
VVSVFAALVNHGHYDRPKGLPSAAQPYPLSVGGEHQAVELAVELIELAASHGCTIDPVIDCSSVLCTFQTAEIVAHELSVRTRAAFQVAQYDAMAERCLGPLANLTVEEIEHLFALDPRHPGQPENWQTCMYYRLPYPGAESLLEAGCRVARHLDQRLIELARHLAPPALKVFVGHDGAFRHAAVVLGALELRTVASIAMHPCRPVLLRYDARAGYMHVAGDWARSTATLPD